MRSLLRPPFRRRQSPSKSGAKRRWPPALNCNTLGAALVTGCTLVAKPAEDTPLTTLKLAELFARVGYPAGVFNVVTGWGHEIGKALVTHPIPRTATALGVNDPAERALAVGVVQHCSLVELHLAAFGGVNVALPAGHIAPNARGIKPLDADPGDFLLSNFLSLLDIFPRAGGVCHPEKALKIARLAVWFLNQSG